MFKKIQILKNLEWNEDNLIILLLSMKTMKTMKTNLVMSPVCTHFLP